MYTFSKTLENKEYIKFALDLLINIGCPISADIHFKNCNALRRNGYCINYLKCTNRKRDFVIAINKRLYIPSEIISTTIHELLHTIPNPSTAHRGVWKKWAEYINLNYKEYNIKTTNTLHFRDFN